MGGVGEWVKGARRRGRGVKHRACEQASMRAGVKSKTENAKARRRKAKSSSRSKSLDSGSEAGMTSFRSRAKSLTKSGEREDAKEKRAFELANIRAGGRAVIGERRKSLIRKQRKTVLALSFGL